MLGEIVGVVTGVGGFVAGALMFGGRLKKAKKEVMDVVVLSKRLLDKYDDVDDDARKLKVELAEAIGALRAVFKV